MGINITNDVITIDGKHTYKIVISGGAKLEVHGEGEVTVHHNTEDSKYLTYSTGSITTSPWDQHILTGTGFTFPVSQDETWSQVVTFSDAVDKLEECKLKKEEDKCSKFDVDGEELD